MTLGTRVSKGEIKHPSNLIPKLHQVHKVQTGESAPVGVNLVMRYLMSVANMLCNIICYGLPRICLLFNDTGATNRARERHVRLKGFLFFGRAERMP